ncbi:MAG: DUF2007 domain-containing protein [Eubacteriaceae bacterium]|jgi:hypothetical protein|nr:DUF2007 domain-containing protein [Eubacteriaceae bacterium]
MDKDLKEVARATDVIDASVLQTYLEANGIPVIQIEKGFAGKVYMGDTGLTDIRLLVSEKHYEEALRLLAEDHSQLVEDQWKE